MERTDQELIINYLQGNKQAFDILASRYLKLVYSSAFYFCKNTHDAEDVAQETFIKLILNLKKYDLSRPFRPWLMQITKRQALDHLKKKRPLAFSSLSEVEDVNPVDLIPDISLQLDKALDLKQTGKLLQGAIQQMPKDVQAIFYLRYIKELTFEEVASALGSLSNTIRSKHRRGILALKKAIK